MVLGIDEVGRGAWAGPVVVGAVAIEPGRVEGLKDSKLLSKKKRDVYARHIRQQAAWVGIGWVHARKIDEIGMSAALKLAARRSIAGAPADIQEIIVDGTIRLIEAENVTLLKKADQLIPAFSAASIIAKVARDHYMNACHELFAKYAFCDHVGYGTAAHRKALDEYGPTPIHRMSFAPMAEKKEAKKSAIINTAGYRAEAAASAFLQSKGFTILERNWKTKSCEIDIVAEKDGVAACVEVKYRKSNSAGNGFEYITKSKQAQMSFAAESWRNAASWTGEINLAAVQVAGARFSVTDFVTEIPLDAAHRARTRQFGS